MKTNYLFSNRLKPLGWILFITGIVLGVLWITLEFSLAFLGLKMFALFNHAFMGNIEYFVVIEQDIIDEIIAILIVIGASLVAFSKEKHEDELIAKMRLESLLWATYISYSILILAILFVFNMAFLWVLIFNMFTILIIFIIRFNWILFKSKKLADNEE